MKTNRNLYLFAAALVAGTMGMTSCSNEEMTPNNPTFDGESVKTQFAINIPVAKNDTRLAEDIVQGQNPNPVFRGMSNIKLIPFSAAPGASTAFTSDAILLEQIDATTGLTNGAKFYSDVQIPVNTNNFLFYAEATRSGDAANKTNGSITAPDEFNNGDLLNGSVINTDNLKFTLTGIASANTEIQNYLKGILNGVHGTLSSEATSTSNETLKQALKNLESLKVGSSDAILALMQDLYDLVKVGGTAANTNVANKIIEYFTDGGSGTLTYKTDHADYKANADNYPAYLGIPNGAAQVAYSSGFSYTSLNASDFTTYTYPAALYYFAASQVGASDATHGAAWSGSSTDDWSSFVNTNYSDNTVKASTQSIVLKSPIQYAVAQLAYNVVFSTTELPDNHGINRAVGTNNFELKGILIGGQKGVDYQFEQDATAAEKTIYDPLTTKQAITNIKSSDFYSLALQTAKRDAAGPTEQTVSFALEFVNNGEDFYGQDGIVPKGGTFYLVGSLSTKDGNDYVFQKAYKTIANITIKNLENARYTIPDLRKTELELGLFVDLDWKAGLSQNVNIE